MIQNKTEAKSKSQVQTFLKPQYLKLALVGALGLALIVAGSIMSRSGKENKPDENAASELKAYQETLAEEIETFVSLIKGAGKVKAYVTLDSGPETVYVKNISVSKNTQSETTPQGQTRETISESETVQPVTGKMSGAGDSLVTEVVIAPKVSGCVVVCEGACDSEVKAHVYKAVQVLLGVPIYRIEVLPMQGGK